MVRLSRFSPEDFVDAAIALVAEGGSSAASMAAIARRVGAPTGSIYHRFDSRAAILAEAWSRIHGAFAGRIAPHLRAGRGREAALAIPAWTRRDPVAARFLLLNEAEALFDAAPPETARREIERQEAELDAAFRGYAGTLDGGASAENLARAKFLVFDGPIALVRPHLLAGGTPPAFVDAMIDELHETLARRDSPAPLKDIA